MKCLSKKWNGHSGGHDHSNFIKIDNMENVYYVNIIWVFSEDDNFILTSTQHTSKVVCQEKYTKSVLDMELSQDPKPTE